MSFSVTGIHDTTYSLFIFLDLNSPRYYYYYLKTNVSFGILKNINILIILINRWTIYLDSSWVPF
jgi:hypothetical protein